jgi:magnesium transporter
VRRTIWPIREVLNNLLRDSAHSNEVRLHLRDCYDHTVELIDLTETYRELGADLMDVYLSSISNRMNEIMKVLTIIATIFAPPSLIAAIYGMNFNTAVSPYNMPELNWYYGYPLILITMAVTSTLVLMFLWWKGWLGALSHRISNNKEKHHQNH